MLTYNVPTQLSQQCLWLIIKNRLPAGLIFVKQFLQYSGSRTAAVQGWLQTHSRTRPANQLRAFPWPLLCSASIFFLILEYVELWFEWRRIDFASRPYFHLDMLAVVVFYKAIMNRWRLSHTRLRCWLCRPSVLQQLSPASHVNGSDAHTARNAL